MIGTAGGQVSLAANGRLPKHSDRQIISSDMGHLQFRQSEPQDMTRHHLVPDDAWQKL